MGSEPAPSIYPADDYIGAARGLEGAGILAYLTGDHLHPHMVDDEAVWADGARWAEGAAEHTRTAARFAGVQAGERILDIGCGIGGPARTMAEEFGAVVVGVSNHHKMLETAERINGERQLPPERVRLFFHDCQLPYPENGFDLGWSLNMLYQVPDKAAMLRAAHGALGMGGRLMVEDWMLTPLATAEDLTELEHHFGSSDFARVDQFVGELITAGFDLTGVEDLGHIARGQMARHFSPQMESYFKPRLVADHGVRGEEAAEDFMEGVEATLRLYQERRMTYIRFLAERD